MKDATLVEAERLRDAAILGQLPAECQQLRDNLAVMRNEAVALRNDLDDTRRRHYRLTERLREANKKTDSLRVELKKKKETIAQLREELKQSERGQTTRQRKVPRQLRTVHFI